MTSHRRRLGAGIWMTYLALVLVVADPVGLVARPAGGRRGGGRRRLGQAWCGQLVEAPAGEAALTTADGPVRVPLDRVVLIHPVDGC